MTYEQALASLPKEQLQLLELDQLLFGISFIRIIDDIPRRVSPKDIPADWIQKMKETKA